eukprot:3084191-Amphidinium_carterae.1
MNENRNENKSNKRQQWSSWQVFWQSTAGLALRLVSLPSSSSAYTGVKHTASIPTSRSSSLTFMSWDCDPRGHKRGPPR